MLFSRFNKNFDNGEWQQDYSNYDLNTRELSVLDQIFQKEFLKNKN